MCKNVEGVQFFPLTPPPLEEYVLYTQFNVDNYG